MTDFPDGAPDGSFPLTSDNNSLFGQMMLRCRHPYTTKKRSIVASGDGAMAFYGKSILSTLETSSGGTKLYFFSGKRAWHYEIPQATGSIIAFKMEARRATVYLDLYDKDSHSCKHLIYLELS